ncbi:replicative DNA helicase [Methylobacterium longum]|uniref:DNA 5'-3' helicase n=1 Tax=Methylobacterium longum TaxID=767694 RepID=A0ABT8AXL8_9HYPH|nr:DnaB-like helicase C-terminal domain-containing protein [Methylobacterium longum]MDN3574641.1 DnaB-like helicase C-terminal domain-containing protein [Methylobacterium longum]GJE13671.1 Replicative DNA helicase [Methylobacterium longum]
MPRDSENVLPFRQSDAPAAPPHNIEAEQALIGILMMKPEQIAPVTQIVRPEHFYFADHQEVFAVIEGLAAAGSTPTPISVKGYLPRPNIGDRPAIAYLTACTGELLSWDAVSYAQVVRDLASRRALLAIAEDLSGKAHTSAPGTLAQAIIDETEQALLDVRAVVPQAHLAGQSAPEASAWMLNRIAQLRSGMMGSTSISTGLHELDRVTNGGFQRGQLWLLAGRPGMGKTVVMTTLSRLAAKTAGVLVYQCEVTRDQQIARYLADLSYVHNRPLPFGKIMAGVEIDDEEAWRIEQAAASFDKLHLRLECEPGVTVAQIAFGVKAEKRRLAKVGVRLGVVFVDYLKFIKVSDRYQGQRVLEIGEISGSLKQLAKSEDICIVLLAQLNRGVEKQEREDRRPTPADLRDSGELEQDADAVLLLFREAVYVERKLKASPTPELADRFTKVQHRLELILGKNRSGPPCTLNLWCDVAHSSIAQTTRGGT